MSPAKTGFVRALTLTCLLGLTILSAPVQCAVGSATESATELAKDNATPTPVDFKNAKVVHDFMDFMVNRHGYSRTDIEQIFAQVQFNAKSLQLIKPAPAKKPKNWTAYRARFVEPQRIQAGVDFWNKYAGTLTLAEKQYGVPAQIIIGIIGVETFYGKNLGNFRVLDVLSSLAFAYPDVPNRDARMAYFLGELEQSLLFARESGIDPFSLLGSYAGAIGWGQFMPSSIRQYAVDFNGDGKIDLRTSPEDVIGSVANFLMQHGWSKGNAQVFQAKIITEHPESMITKELEAGYTLGQLAPVAVSNSKNAPPQQLYGLIDLQNGDDPAQYWLAGHNFFVLTKYNRSYFYAMSVIELGKAVCRARSPDNSCD